MKTLTTPFENPMIKELVKQSNSLKNVKGESKNAAELISLVLTMTMISL
jgi:hypothetical protein